ncbi:MAG: VIT1/CCC1 transporter family protein [Candidatus Thermoplasmatota archaeon]
MSSNKLDSDILKQIENSQKDEITEYHIYQNLSKKIKNNHNKKVIQDISNQEKKHYNFWKKYTKKDVSPSKLKIWFYLIFAKLFGITFSIKLMEKGEEDAQVTYSKISKQVPEAKKIIEEEDEHEHKLIDMLDEERLKYMGSIIRGLNDALVELTGAIAGLTFVLQKTNLIALTGLITGIAASFSMGGSEYLGSKSEENDSKNPKKASFYTASAYIITVLFLIYPYLIFSDIYFSLGLMVVNALIVIFIFSFYISIAKDLSFKKRFSEMASISLGIAFLTFIIGFIIRATFGIEI